MDVTATVSVFFLHCVWLTSTNQDKTFVMSKDQGPVSAPAAVTIPSSSRPLSCHSACLRRNSCLAFSMSSSPSCSLYDTYMDDPNSQLQTQTGQVFFNLAPKEKVSLMTENTTEKNLGKANFFPQLRIKEAGRVMRWQVRCASAGVVVLAIWREETALSVTLIGKHYITISEGMLDQLVTYDVPMEETVLVEAGDFVGFHYDDNGPRASVRVFNADQTPDGVAIEKMYSTNIYDNELPVGTAIMVDEARKRAPSLAVFVA